MPNAKILRLEPNATYIPLTCVGFRVGVTQILGLASGVFAFLDTDMLVCLTQKKSFVSQWNIGFKRSEIYFFESFKGTQHAA